MDALAPGEGREDPLGQLDLAVVCRAEAEPVGRRLLDGRHDLRGRVAEDERPPRADEVDVLLAFGVGEVGALTPDEEGRGAADGTEGANG